MQRQIRKKVRTLCKGWGCSLVVALLIATSIKSAIADWNDIPSGSMEPTVLIGDRVFVNKLAYDLKVPYTTMHLAKWGDPCAGDIVVFYSPENGKRLIKRVVGLPGDIISMRRNQLYINDQVVEYGSLDPDVVKQLEADKQADYRFYRENLAGRDHGIMLSLSRPSIQTFGPLVVPEGKYFMMGDNRDNSADSRFFGFVDRERIVGRATRVVISREGSFLHPRWDRFFRELS
jgi:signal peptidase I